MVYQPTIIIVNLNFFTTQRMKQSHRNQPSLPSRPEFQCRKQAVVDLSCKLTRRKTQRALLESATSIDLLSSLRPKVGKVFINTHFEEQKRKCLEVCRIELVKIAIEEAEIEISELSTSHARLLNATKNEFSELDYQIINKTAKSNERKIICTQNKKHCNKINTIMKKGIPASCNYTPPTVEKTITHNDTLHRKKTERNKRRRFKNKTNRNKRQNDRIDYIKNNGLVINFSNIDIPDGAYLVLAKGNSFVPAVSASKHDLVFDIGEFLRKLAWRAYFQSQSRLPNASDATRTYNSVDPVKRKLRLQSFDWSPVPSKLFDFVSGKIKHWVDGFKCTDIKKHNNLTYLERQGLYWCIKMRKENNLHFSQADKGGATVIMDPSVVNNIILDKLTDSSKFQSLGYDPRAQIESNLLSVCKENMKSKGMTDRELFLVTGNTGKGKSHNPRFKSGKPNPFPLFKLHSLSTEELSAKVIPPIRLVTSMKFSATKRLSLFIDAILNPVAIEFCGSEYLKDTPDFLRKLLQFDKVLCEPGVQLFTLDVKALYPSINPKFVPSAVEMALDVVTQFTEKKKKMILKLVKFSISNACVHYRDEWYKMLEGIPTGGSDSVCFANIYVKWVILKFSQSRQLSTSFSRYSNLLLRFIDDLFDGWSGSFRQFKHFVATFNSFGKQYGVIFDKEQFGDSVNFLDVVVSNSCGNIVTDLYVKPTDARRYLHRSSFHPAHTFAGIPYSQMRRAALICSNDYLRDFAINEMCKSFLECGYSEAKLIDAKNRVLNLKRSDLLVEATGPVDDSPLVCVLSFSVDAPAIKEHVTSFDDDIKLLAGTSPIVFSMRRNANISSLLFNKYGFSQIRKINTSQKCNVANCNSCVLKRGDCSMVDIVDNFTLKPDKTLTCKSDCVIYVARCKLCMDFYIGQTMSEEHVRMNGHRDKFHADK